MEISIASNLATSQLQLGLGTVVVGVALAKSIQVVSTVQNRVYYIFLFIYERNYNKCHNATLKFITGIHSCHSHTVLQYYNATLLRNWNSHQDTSTLTRVAA